MIQYNQETKSGEMDNMRENKNYNINISLGEYHLIFAALQEKSRANKAKMASMESYEGDNIYDEVISNPTMYISLQQQNGEIDALMDFLYDVTGKQLKIRLETKEEEGD